MSGQLGERFGKVHRLALGSAAEAVRALGVLLPGFKQYLVSSKVRGVPRQTQHRSGRAGPPPGAADILIAPVVLGIALMAAATIATGGVAGLAIAGAGGWGGALAASSFAGASAMFGLSLAIGGVAQMVTGQQARIDSSESVYNRPSYNFTGIKNTITQGNPVPLCYGEMTTGSAHLSLGIMAEDQQ
nr:tail assembly protein [Pseudomonas parafulva]